MKTILITLGATLADLLRSRGSLQLEILALRQQLPFPGELDMLVAGQCTALTGGPHRRWRPLCKYGELELMYAHLQSLRNLEKVLVRISGDESPANEWPEVDSAPEGTKH